MAETTRRAPTFYDIPIGSPTSTCKGPTCGETIYWVRNPKTGNRMPLSIAVPGGIAPSAGTPGDDSTRFSGKGISHYANCPDASTFSHRGRR
jgi:hypothetical protein